MENQNSVCFVGNIEKINPIVGADNIVQAIISGWECVIQKGVFPVGSLVVIATTDAIIPLDMAERLGITKYLKHRKKTDQYTVKTTKLRGVYSTATIIDEDKNHISKEGIDMMDYYKIFKYEEPDIQVLTTGGKKLRYHKNPNFHIYYKFPNAKNVGNMFNEDDDVVITRKIHGTNARYGIVKKDRLSLLDKIKKFFGNKYVEYDFVYGSHNVEKGSSSQGFYSDDVWKKIAEKFKIKEKLWDFIKNPRAGLILGEGIIMYCEIYGPGIQSYYDYGNKEINFAVFDFKLNGEYVNNEDYCYLISGFYYPSVDILYQGKFNIDIINSFNNKAYILNSKIPHEGVVVKHISGDRSKIAKYINPEYLEFQSKKEDSTDFH